MGDSHCIVQSFALEEADEVSCYYCGRDFYGDVEAYRRGEAVLAEAGHPPYNAEANYICIAHLSPGTKIYDPETKMQVELGEYAKLGRANVIGKMYLRYHGA
jgi:hypothetical protein